VTAGSPARSVRTFRVGTRLDTCVADDRSGALYVSEQRFGLWRYQAEPGGGLKRTLVDRAKTRWGGYQGHVTASIEGLAIAGNRLYVSSQGSTDFVVYSRVRNVYLGRFRVTGSSEIDGCQDTLGIEARSEPMGSAFPTGLFVCEDSYNLDGTTVRRENYKLVPLDVTARLS
jgi:3-phytase